MGEEVSYSPGCPSTAWWSLRLHAVRCPIEVDQLTGIVLSKTALPCVEAHPQLDVAFDKPVLQFALPRAPRTELRAAERGRIRFVRSFVRSRAVLPRHADCLDRHACGPARRQHRRHRPPHLGVCSSRLAAWPYSPTCLPYSLRRSTRSTFCKLQATYRKRGKVGWKGGRRWQLQLVVSAVPDLPPRTSNAVPLLSDRPLGLHELFLPLAFARLPL